nr:midnolin-like [Oncorhynchus nerka]
MDQHPSARSCTSRGAPSCEAVPSEPSMNLYIHSTTGTRFELSLPLEETVEGLKRKLSQRLKVPKERLTLLHKETRLSSGKLQDLGISDGSKLTLVPTVEAGLMSQASRPEQSVMQALESLTETQVSDFLSGRSPLTLALRVGDHMMFVQLQLAAQQSGGQQLQHRHLIARGGAEGTMGQSTGASGGSTSGHHPRVPTPHHHHPHPHPHPHPQSHSHPHPHLSRPHPVPPPSTSSAAFPPAPSHQPSPPMYPSSSSLSSSHCNTPPAPRPSQLPGSMFSRSHQPFPGRPSPSPGSVPQSTPTAVPCPEVRPLPTNQPTTAFLMLYYSQRTTVTQRSARIQQESTLHPNCQDGTGRPRRDIGTILQILNDLLSATRHYQGVPPSLTQLRYQTQCGSPSPASPSPSPPPSPPATTAGIAGISAKATSVPASSPISPPLHPLVQCQSQIRMCKPPGDRVRQTENRATRCKVERLQLLMQQKRLRRKARRDSRAPYHWLPNRKAGRSNSNSSTSSEGSMDLDFDDSVWKPDVKADMKTEFVMA